MKLENNFTIDAPVEKAWEALNSPETVAPCFPGATLTEYEGDSFAGTVKIKLGPIAMTYKGKGTYVTRDEAAHEVVIDANGRDSRGNGTAKATVTASLAADGPDRTTVSMVTDMTITGKPAQFGRGVIADVADKIIGQFSACVARKLAPPAEAGVAEPGVAEPGVAEPGVAEPVSEAAAPASEAMAAAAAPSSSSTNGVAASATGGPVLGDPAAGGTSEADAPASTTVGSDASGVSEALGGAGTSEVPASTSMSPDTGAARVSSGTAAASSTPAPPVPATPTGTPAAVSAPGAASVAAVSASATPASTATATSARPTPSPTPRVSTTPRAPVHSEVDAIDLLDTAGAPVLKRLVPVAGGALLVALVVLLVRRLRAG